MQENEPFSPEAEEGRGRNCGGRPGVVGYGEGRARAVGEELRRRAGSCRRGLRPGVTAALDGGGRRRRAGARGRPAVARSGARLGSDWQVPHE